MSQLPILLAAWGFGDLLLPAIVVIIWVIGQLVSSRQQEAAPQPRAVPDLLKPKQGDASQEMDEFLRQMAHRRGDQRPAQVEVVPPARLRSNPLAVEPVEVEIVKPQMPVDDGVAQHVRAHAFGDDIAKRVAHLGERIGLADEAIESHMEQAFDHKVGELTDTSFAIREPAATSPTGGQSRASNHASALDPCRGDGSSWRGCRWQARRDAGRHR